MKVVCRLNADENSKASKESTKEFNVESTVKELEDETEKFSERQLPKKHTITKF